MLSQAALQDYRRMSPRERIAEMRALVDVAERALRVLPAEEARRRLAAHDRIRRASIEARLERLRQLAHEPAAVR